MSSVLGFAAVTATLRNVLNAHVTGVVSSAQATAVRLDKIDDTKPTVNLFLYQATPNPGYRNVDSPTRDSSGRLVRRPVTAYDLHYLVTARDADETIAQVLLAAAARALHMHPLLTADQIAAETAKEKPPVKTATLHKQVECIRIAPNPLTLDDLHKLWGLFPDTKYQLSLAYTVTTVILEADDAVASAPPVQEPRIGVRPLVAPEIAAAFLDDALELVVRGNRLGEDLSVTVAELAAKLLEGSESEVRAERPAALGYGVHSVRVARTVGKGFALDSRAILVWAPVIVSAAKNGTDLRITLERPARTGQEPQAVLINLADLSQKPKTLALPALGADTTTLDFPLAGTTGDFAVRVRLGGAESLLDYQETGPVPKVTL